MVRNIYPVELHFNEANPLILKLPFLTCICPFLMILFLPKFMINVTILIFKIVIFPFSNGDVPRSTSYGVYISQLIRFARASSHVADFNFHNKLLTQKLLKQGFMLSLSDNNQSDISEAFNSTSRYLDDLPNIDNPYFEQTVGQIYPTEL